MKELSQMSKPEKKNFLSMDFTERMIHIEQNVSASFNKPLPYNKTSFYKNMTALQRKKFESYLRSKNAKRVLSFFLVTIPVFALAVLNINFTGNAVRDSISAQNLSILNYSLMAVLGIAMFSYLISLFRRIRRNRMFNKNARLINDIVVKKSKTKKS